jgi:hypothetical protein
MDMRTEKINTLANSRAGNYIGRHAAEVNYQSIWLLKGR